MKRFMQEMLKEVQYCQKTIATKFKKPLKMSDKDEQHFQEESDYMLIKIFGLGTIATSQVITGD